MTTTTEDYDWEPVGYRVIPGWSGYVMNSELDVWSLSRQVPCKGGKTKQNAAKQLKVRDGRVSFSQDGKRGRYHVRNDLYPLAFPELVRPRIQVLCRHGHPLRPPLPDRLFSGRLGECRVTVWGTGNRICLRCWDATEAYDNHTYSSHYGVAAPPGYGPAAAQPQLHSPSGRFGEDDVYQLAELEWGDGFIITSSPR